MTDASATIDALLEGAMRQFATYGFQRTSMADIARAAGVSRTSLYNHFPGKEDVFRALSARINQRVHADVVAAVHDDGPWQERLLKIINARVGWVYDLLHASQHGRELVDEKNRICGGEILAANDRIADLVAGLLAENAPAAGDSHELAAVLLQAVSGVLEQAQTRQAAERGVALLIAVFCRGLAGG